MTAPKPNAELAYQTLDYIDANPEEWDQAQWYCGTAACFAGRALLLSGCTLVRTGINVAQVASGPDRLIGMLAEYAAYDVLGITIEQSDPDDEWLFDPDNEREDLGRLVAEIFGPRPEHCGYPLAHPAHDWTRLADDEQPDDQPAHCDGVTGDAS